MKSSKLPELLEAIHRQENEEEINSLEEEVAGRIEDFILHDSFFKLPLKNIFSIVSKVDFYDFENYSNLLKNIINGTIKEHENEKETLFLLYHIKVKGNKTLKLEDCIEILHCFKTVELFTLLNEKYRKILSTPEVDTNYIIQRKDREIEELNKQIEQMKGANELEQIFPPIQKKPIDFESNLFKAVIKGKLDSIQYLIEKQEVKINQQSNKDDIKSNINKGDTALHIAIKYNHDKIAQYLFLKGARYDIPNDIGKSAFLYACENKNMQFVKSILLRENVSISIEELCRDDPLHFACEQGNIPIVHYIIEKGNMGAKDQYHRTPLHFAAEGGCLQIVQYLIEKGANIEAKDSNLRTPLHDACKNGHLPVIEYLIEKGANIEAKNKYQRTPFHIACDQGYLQIVQYLIEKGANIEATDNKKHTPIHYACKNGHLPIVEYLIEKGADVNTKDVTQWTPLHISSDLGHVEVVKLLVSKGANIKAKDKFWRTPYDVACNRASQSQIDIIRELLK